MQYVRYLKDTETRKAGEIVEQPDLVAFGLFDKGIAEFSYSPEEQAEIDELATEADAIERGEEVGLSTFDTEAAETPPEPPEDYHDSKPPLTRQSVRRAILDNSKASRASLSDKDKAASEEVENED